MRNLFGINELFTSKPYSYKLIDDSPSDTGFKNLKYKFSTEKGYNYLIYLQVNRHKGKLDFEVEGYGKSETINNFDLFKVMLTIDSILDDNKVDILYIEAEPKRIQFYKKIIKYVNYIIISEKRYELLVIRKKKKYE